MPQPRERGRGGEEKQIGLSLEQDGREKKEPFSPKDQGWKREIRKEDRKRRAEEEEEEATEASMEKFSPPNERIILMSTFPLLSFSLSSSLPSLLFPPFLWNKTKGGGGQKFLMRCPLPLPSLVGLLPLPSSFLPANNSSRPVIRASAKREREGEEERSLFFMSFCKSAHVALGENERTRKRWCRTREGKSQDDDDSVFFLWFQGKKKRDSLHFSTFVVSARVCPQLTLQYVIEHSGGGEEKRLSRKRVCSLARKV